MNHQFYTYLHCKPNGDPFYVGKGHGRRAYIFSGKKNPHYQRIITKYGVENVLVFVFECESEQEAFADERHQIAQLRFDGYNLANICDGGEGVTGHKHSDESRAKISARQIGRRWTPESIAKRSATNRGRKRSLETRVRMSQSKKGKLCRPETRAKLSAINMGHTHTVEARAKISAAHKGNHYSLGYRHTPEALAKIAAASRAFKRTPEHCAKISAALRARAVVSPCPPAR